MKTAVAALLSVGALAGAARAEGYRFESTTGPTVAFIVADDSGYPDIAAPQADIAPELLALSQGSFEQLLYQPEPLSTGYRGESAAGPLLAWTPSDASGEATSQWAMTAPPAGEQQLGALPVDADEPH